MYCSECGFSISENEKFCKNCGKKNLVDDPKNETLEKPEMYCSKSGVIDYIDDRIKSATTFINAHDFIAASKPLKFVWIILSISAIITVQWMGLGIFIGFIATYFICIFKYMKYNNKKYPLSLSVNIDDLIDFLCTNLCDYPYAEWQRGIPSFFGIKSTDMKIIECSFQNKGYIRIIFEDNKAYYKIVVHRIKKKWLFDGGSSNPFKIYKCAYQATPVLEAAIEYYLINSF